LAKKRRLNPNRFQKQDGKSLFSLDPIRRDLLKWGVVAGAGGGFLMLQEHLVWRIAGVFVVVFVSNYHISKASRRIPRWHATVLSFLGVMVAIFGVIITGTIVMAYFRSNGG
jgi:hypothetical protein